MWDSIEQYTFTKYQNFKLIVSTFGNEPKTIHETNLVDLPRLNWFLPEFTSRKFGTFVVKILKIRYDFKSLNNTLETRQHLKVIFTAWWRLPSVAKPQLKSESSVLFTAIIPILFGNEVTSTTKLISSLERTTCSLLFETKIIKHILFSFWDPKGLSQSG